MLEEKSTERRRKKFWNSKRILTAFLIIIGIILGMLLQHYYIEPALGQTTFQELKICKAQNQVLDEENDACYQQNYDLNRMLADCERDLGFCLQNA